jgi:hypothetical protein
MDRSGLGYIDWRTYVSCSDAPPPCEQPGVTAGGEAIIVVTKQTAPGAAVGRAITSTQPSWLPIGVLRFQWNPGTDVMTIVGGRETVTFCGPKNSGTCGL